MVDKQQVLAEAAYTLNSSENPWEVTVEGDSIIARWKWMDAVFFAPHEVNAEIQQYTFTVTLTDRGTYKELDRTAASTLGGGSKGGNATFGGSKSMFIGTTSQKSFKLGIGINNETGEAGIVGFKFDTELVKKAVREYLTACGWKKAGWFG